MTNLADATAFLNAFGAGGFTFQTFDESDLKRRKLSRVFHAKNIGDIATKLTQLNEQGAGIFVTIGETDGTGRKIKNIKRIRALFIDGDEIPRPEKWHRPPDFLCWRNATRWHAYWLVSDCPLDKFTDAQKRLIQFYRSDPAVHDLSRVMRVPGFLHRKHEPVPYHFERGNGNGPARLVDVLEGLPQLMAHRIVTEDIEIQRIQNAGCVQHLTIDYVIQRALPGRIHKNNSLAFVLAHGVRGWESQQGLAPDAARAIKLFFNPWYEQNMHLRPGQSREQYLEEFLVAYAKVRAPLGCGDSLAIALQRADVMPLPEIQGGVNCPMLRYLAAVCRELQRLSSPDPFFLSARTAMSILKFNAPIQGLRKLQALQGAKVIEVVVLGGPETRKATRFRYLLEIPPLCNMTDMPPLCNNEDDQMQIEGKGQIQ